MSTFCTNSEGMKYRQTPALSPLYSGERVGVRARRDFAGDPHPDPLPAYREREKRAGGDDLSYFSRAAASGAAIRGSGVQKESLGLLPTWNTHRSFHEIFQNVSRSPPRGRGTAGMQHQCRFRL